MWQARQQKYKLALGFILNKCPDLLQMVNATIVQNEDTLRTRVWVGKQNDQLSEKFNKASESDRTWNDAIHDDSIHCKDWED